jgi:site-specific recombinase XerC
MLRIHESFFLIGTHHLLMAGVPVRAAHVLLGHKRIETTLRYSHLGEAQLREVVERLTAQPTDARTSTEQTAASQERVAASA